MAIFSGDLAFLAPCLLGPKNINKNRRRSCLRRRTPAASLPGCRGLKSIPRLPKGNGHKTYVTFRNFDETWTKIGKPKGHTARIWTEILSEPGSGRWWPSWLRGTVSRTIACGSFGRGVVPWISPSIVNSGKLSVVSLETAFPARICLASLVAYRSAGRCKSMKCSGTPRLRMLTSVSLFRNLEVSSRIETKLNDSRTQTSSCASVILERESAINSCPPPPTPPNPPHPPPPPPGIFAVGRGRSPTPLISFLCPPTHKQIISGFNPQPRIHGERGASSQKCRIPWTWAPLYSTRGSLATGKSPFTSARQAPSSRQFLFLGRKLVTQDPPRKRVSTPSISSRLHLSEGPMLGQVSERSDWSSELRVTRPRSKKKPFRPPETPTCLCSSSPFKANTSLISCMLPTSLDGPSQVTLAKE